MVFESAAYGGGRYIEDFGDVVDGDFFGLAHWSKISIDCHRNLS